MYDTSMAQQVFGGTQQGLTHQQAKCKNAEEFPL